MGEKNRMHAGAARPDIPTVRRAFSTRTEDIPVIEVQEPKCPPTEFVVGLPHSGLYLPSDDFPARFILHPSLDSAVDIGAERTFDLREIGAVVIKSNIHRNALDLNRTKKIGKAKTVFCRFDRDKKRKYLDTGNAKRGRFRKEEERPFYRKMYDAYYGPFYTRVEYELNSLNKSRHALLISGHTFGDRAGDMPGICIGTGNGKKADEKLAVAFRQQLLQCKHLDIAVSVDEPFTGKEGLSGWFGSPKHRRHALLVEVNRRLFMDEDGIDARTIELVRKCICEAIKRGVLPLL